MTLSLFTLFVALVISAISAFYSITGLTTIFSSAFWSIVIMGGSLEVAKVTVTVWLHKYWSRAGWKLKIYLVPAIVMLMIITSMGTYGYLSKAHMDQGVPAGDVAAKVAILDEKIKTQRENIDAARKALTQLDASVDQTLSRTTTERGAGKAVEIRKSQNKERSLLRTEIEEAQRTIVKLNDERAPIASELRKAEAEVGPLKYVAALLYGDNPDANLLERAVRWVIIILVVVFDPLAIMMVLASTESIKWDQELKNKIVEENINNVVPDVEPIIEESVIVEMEEPIVIPETEVESNNEASHIELHFDDKKYVKTWKALNPQTTLKEQRRLFERGVINRLPWDEPEFISLVDSGKFE